MAIPVKPRVLIVDDSRIVRATLIKQIEGMFEFREALDGEQAWETLLLDPSIRVVITDLTMPKLDGYGLLHRIRQSRIGRIRTLPVVVVSGSDDNAERERAKAAGATDLITKGIGTAQLLSRLDILSKLVGSQQEFERSLETLLDDGGKSGAMPLPSAENLYQRGESLLATAVSNRKNFVILNVRVGLMPVDASAAVALPPDHVIHAIGQLLQHTVRQTDLAAKTGDAEFTLATSAINAEAARCFAHRICRAITHAHLVDDTQMSFVASCGLASLSDDDMDAKPVTMQEMQAIARRRAALGLSRAITGVIGQEEEYACEQGGRVLPLATQVNDEAYADEQTDMPDMATLLQWVKSGRLDDVLPHLARLSAELQPLVELLLKHGKT